MRIGVVVDYIVSEYNESLIKGAAQCCKDNNIELLIFEIGGILKTCKNFEYQRMSISAHIKKNNLDGIVFTSGTQVHEITQDDFISYLKSYKSIPIVNISNVIPGIPSVVVDCDEAYEALIEYIITKQESRKIAVMGVFSNSHEVENRTRIIKKVLMIIKFQKRTAVSGNLILSIQKLMKCWRLLNILIFRQELFLLQHLMKLPVWMFP